MKSVATPENFDFIRRLLTGKDQIARIQQEEG